MHLFLDIDGVMIPAKGWKTLELLNDGFPAFSKKAIDALQFLLTEDTTVMLTTSHKANYTIDEWKAIFRKRGLSVDKIKALDNNTGNLSREAEILNWFKANNLREDFLIIDDDKSLNSLPEFLKKNLILTSSLVGLIPAHVENANAILGKKIKFS